MCACGGTKEFAVYKTRSNRRLTAPLLTSPYYRGRCPRPHCVITASTQNTSPCARSWVRALAEHSAPSKHQGCHDSPPARPSTRLVQRRARRRRPPALAEPSARGAPPPAYQGSWAPPRPPAAGRWPVSPWPRDPPSWSLSRTTSGCRDAGPWGRPRAHSPRPTCRRGPPGEEARQDSVGLAQGTAEPGISTQRPPPAPPAVAWPTRPSPRQPCGAGWPAGATAERAEPPGGAAEPQPGAGPQPGRGQEGQGAQPNHSRGRGRSRGRGSSGRRSSGRSHRRGRSQGASAGEEQGQEPSKSTWEAAPWEAGSMLGIAAVGGI